MFVALVVQDLFFPLLSSSFLMLIIKQIRLFLYVVLCATLVRRVGAGGQKDPHICLAHGCKTPAQTGVVFRGYCKSCFKKKTLENTNYTRPSRKRGVFIAVNYVTLDVVRLLMVNFATPAGDIANATLLVVNGIIRMRILNFASHVFLIISKDFDTVLWHVRIILPKQNVTPCNVTHVTIRNHALNAHHCATTVRNLRL